VHLSMWAKKCVKRVLGGLVTTRRSCYKGICFIVIVYYPIIKILYCIITNYLYIYDRRYKFIQNTHNNERWTSYVLSYTHSYISLSLIWNWVIIYIKIVYGKFHMITILSYKGWNKFYFKYHISLNCITIYKK